MSEPMVCKRSACLQLLLRKTHRVVVGYSPLAGRLHSLRARTGHLVFNGLQQQLLLLRQSFNDRMTLPLPFP